MQNFYNPYQQNMFGQTMQPMAQRPMFPEPQQYMQQAQPMIWVNGFNEANNYPVLANCVIPLWDKNGSYVYKRSADSAGQPSTQAFKLTPVSEMQNETEYVTRQEFADFIKSMNYQPKFTQKEDSMNE